MSDAVHIRPAKVGDEPRLAPIGAATFLETFAGQIAGDALLTHCAVQHAPHKLDAAEIGNVELKRIYLLPRFHGRGAAERLLDAALLAAQASNRLLLGVKADNTRAIAFYRKHGFQQIPTRRFDVGGTMHDDTVMARLMLEGTG